MNKPAGPSQPILQNFSKLANTNSSCQSVPQLPCNCPPAMLPQNQQGSTVDGAVTLQRQQSGGSTHNAYSTENEEPSYENTVIIPGEFHKHILICVLKDGVHDIENSHKFIMLEIIAGT